MMKETCPCVRYEALTLLQRNGCGVKSKCFRSQARVRAADRTADAVFYRADAVFYRAADMATSDIR